MQPVRRVIFLTSLDRSLSQSSCFLVGNPLHLEIAKPLPPAEKGVMTTHIHKEFSSGSLQAENVLMACPDMDAKDN